MISGKVRQAMTRRNNRQAMSTSMRARIAAAAARIMAEDGIDDFALAKRKAARSLGAAETEALPGNDEIEAELRAYRALYQAEEHPAAHRRAARARARGDAGPRALSSLPHRPGAQGHRRPVRRDRSAALSRELQRGGDVPPRAQHPVRYAGGAALLRRPRPRGQRVHAPLAGHAPQAVRCSTRATSGSRSRPPRPAASWIAPGSPRSARCCAMTPGRREALILGAVGAAAAAPDCWRERSRFSPAAAQPPCSPPPFRTSPGGPAACSSGGAGFWCATSGRPGARPAAKRCRCWPRSARNMRLKASNL